MAVIIDKEPIYTNNIIVIALTKLKNTVYEIMNTVEAAFGLLTLLHSKQPKLHRVLAILSAVGLINEIPTLNKIHFVARVPS